MCYPVACTKCGKTTWAGCGLHKERVMAKVPKDQQCSCARDKAAEEKPADNRSGPSGNPSGVREVRNHAEMDVVFAESKGKLLVVDFFATWCAPCKAMAPKFEAYAKKYPEVVFLKVNGDECNACLETAGVAAFPTFHLYRDGKLLAQVVGPNDAALGAAIAEHMPKA